jgi:NADH-quinone oxidoreductase subunit N
VAFIGFIMSMVSVYYYLLVAKAMYMREPADTAPFAVGGPLRWAAVVSMLLTILFGVYPAPLSEIANAAAKSLM